MNRLIFSLTDEDKASLEQLREERGARSVAEVIRDLIRAEIAKDATELQIPPETLERIDAYAKELSLPRHAALIEMVDKGLRLARAMSEPSIAKLDTRMVPVLDPAARRQAFLDRQQAKPDRPPKRR